MVCIELVCYLKQQNLRVGSNKFFSLLAYIRVDLNLVLDWLLLEVP
jgi:hypothetical protein